MYTAPVNRCISRECAQTAGRLESSVGFTDRCQPFRIDRRLPRGHFGRVAPETSDVFDRNFLSSDVSVEKRLVVAACEFDDDVFNGFFKFTIAGQTYVEVSRLTQPVTFANHHHWVLFERRNDALDSVDRIRKSRAPLWGSPHPFRARSPGYYSEDTIERPSMLDQIPAPGFF